MKRPEQEEQPAAPQGEPASPEMEAVRAELEELQTQRLDILAQIGEEAVALYAAGEVQLPGMGLLIARLQDIQGRISALEARGKALWQIHGQGAAGTCSACGASLWEGDRFCPQCGQPVR